MGKWILILDYNLRNDLKQLKRTWWLKKQIEKQENCLSLTIRYISLIISSASEDKHDTTERSASPKYTDETWAENTGCGEQGVNINNEQVLLQTTVFFMAVLTHTPDKLDSWWRLLKGTASNLCMCVCINTCERDREREKGSDVLLSVLPVLSSSR